MKTSIILALFSLFLISCNKETVYFHVKIINPATGEGYANHKFYIKSSRTGMNGENVKTRYSGTTNDNGEAIVRLKVNKDTWFLTCEAVPNTCYINNPKQHYSNRSDKNPEFIFEIAPCAQLKLKIQNVNCEGPSDLLNFKNKYSYTQWESGWSTDRFGCYTWESPEYFNVPAGWRIYHWRVIRPSETVIYEDSIFLNAGQDHMFEMLY